MKTYRTTRTMEFVNQYISEIIREPSWITIKPGKIVQICGQYGERNYLKEDSPYETVFYIAIDPHKPLYGYKDLRQIYEIQADKLEELIDNETLVED